MELSVEQATSVQKCTLKCTTNSQWYRITTNKYQLSYMITKCVIIKPEFNKGDPLHPKAIIDNE